MARTPFHARRSRQTPIILRLTRRRQRVWGIVAASFLLGLLTGPMAQAGPALPEAVQIQQPDGTVVVAQLGGDEHLNWTSVDSLLVEQAGDDFWYYLRLVDAQLQRSEQRAGLDFPPADAARPEDLVNLQQAAASDEPQVPASPPQATEPLLVILVEFQADVSLAMTDTAWSTAFFGTIGKTVRTFFDQASRNTFHFSPVPETAGTVDDGVVRTVLTYPHPRTGSSITSANRQIVYDALVAADAFVDFASFDTNLDGKLSESELHVITVVAGSEASSSSPQPSVWAHHGVLSTGPTLDGVTLCDSASGSGYCQVGEMEQTMVNGVPEVHITTIGTACHELGHSLGLPDLYDVTPSPVDSYGVGAYCLMGYGCWGTAAGDYPGATPTLPSAWCRAHLGFLSPTLITAAGTCSLVQASDAANSNVIKIATSDPNQYFLVENRQLSGFDEGLYDVFSKSAGGTAGGGITIWHVDDSISTNNDKTHKHVDLEEANDVPAGGPELDRLINRGNRQHLYYSGNATQFDASSTPNSKLYNNTTTYVSISNVSASAASMDVTVGIPVTISGYVRAGSIPIPGVTMQGLPGNPNTNGSGFYKVTMASGYSGTVTPTKTAYAFSPVSRTYTSVASSSADQDYAVSSRTLYIDDDAQADPGPGTPTVSDPLEDGSADHPFDAIQEAVNFANNEDVLVLLPGTYNGAGNYNIDTGTKALTIRSILPQAPAAVAATVIDCQQAGRAFYFHAGVTTNLLLSGVTIVNGYISGYGGAIYCTSNSNPTITHCVIQSCASADTGIGGGGAIASIGARPAISYCAILGNQATSTGGQGLGGGIYHYGSTALTITNCIFAGNSAARYGGAIYCRSSNPTIDRCTIVDNVAQVYTNTGAIYLPDRTFTASNTIFWNNGPQAGISAITSPAITYSDVQGGFTGTGNLDSDPALTAGWHLPSTSLCVGAGNPSFAPAGDLDIDGQPRLMFTYLDIGADEFTWEGDSSGDGYVDVVDLLMLVDAFGTLVGDPAYDYRCDFNDDGAVDVVDQMILVENFGM